jgi:hypothetical protein
MASVTFEDIHAHFHERLREPKIASGDLFHYYKIFQHAASYELHQSETKLIASTVDRPLYQTRLRFLIRQLLREQHRVKLSPIVLLDDHRTIETPIGKQSYYFDRIARLFPLNGISVVADKDEPSAFDWAVSKVDLGKYANRKLGLASRRVLKDIQKVLGMAAKVYGVGSSYYQHLASCFTVFFEDFHRYYSLFDGQNVKRLIITMHYHREGLIAAAHMHGIEVLEFQHGLIAEQDLYYVYPEEVRQFAGRALFPNHMYVFGQYWKDVLLRGSEFKPEQITVAGDYSLQSSGRARYYGEAKENAILIGAQKNMPELYVRYVEQLLHTIGERYPDWKVWVKLHPLEKKPEHYAHLKDHAQCEVFGKGSELMPLVCRCKIQVSVYSTTFFDALGLGVTNLSIQNYGDSADYARAMVTENVAFPIEFGDDPIEKSRFLNSGDLLPLSAVYGPFSLEL